MRRSIILAIATLLAPVPAMAQGVPNWNIATSCKATIPDPEEPKSCVNTELKARTVLQKEWNQLPEADRLSCLAQPSDRLPPRYIDLAICLYFKMRTTACAGHPGMKYQGLLDKIEPDITQFSRICD